MAGRRISSLSAVAAVAGLWLLLAPASLGGRLSYVVVSQGTSMGSSLRYGDLAVMRHASTFEIGHVVAYEDPDLKGRVIIHRVLDRKDGRLVTKGDANDFIDSFRPAEVDVLGRMWTRIPRVGSLAIWLRVPGHAAVVTGLVVLMLIGFGPAREQPPREARSPPRVARPSGS